MSMTKDFKNKVQTNYQELCKIDQPNLHCALGYRLIKRFFDLVLFLFLAPFALVLVAFFGLWVKLDSPGPIFFVQERVGMDGRPFKVYKLRSMVDNQEDPGLDYTEVNDQRVTRVGRFIRRFRIDELPQLMNVFLNQMSFIGPRPLLAKDYQDDPLSDLRTHVKPGLSGLAQVLGGNDLSTPEKIKIDLYYCRHISFKMDLWIFGMTLKVIVSGRGAR